MDLLQYTEKPFRILIIDDLEIERRHIIDSINSSNIHIEIFEAANGLEGLKSAIHNKFDLIICDLVMPTMDGFKFLEMLVSRTDLQDIPVIMLTAQDEQKLKVAGLEHGACDYLLKPFDTEELVARIKVHLKLKLQKDVLKNSNLELTEMTNKDHLTQVLNRKSMMEILEREFQRSHRKGHSLSLVMIDIDHFKQVNDQYGHQAGDLVLKSLAELSQGHLRSYDSVARYGGEEFALILPDTPRDGAFLVAERLRVKIENLSFTGDMSRLNLTVSMGVATYPDNSINSVDKLIKAADDLLYRAKNQGRNRVVAYD